MYVCARVRVLLLHAAVSVENMLGGGRGHLLRRAALRAPKGVHRLGALRTCNVKLLYNSKDYYGEGGKIGQRVDWIGQVR